MNSTVSYSNRIQKLFNYTFDNTGRLGLLSNSSGCVYERVGGVKVQRHGLSIIAPSPFSVVQIKEFGSFSQLIRSQTLSQNLAKKGKEKSYNFDLHRLRN